MFNSNYVNVYGLGAYKIILTQHDNKGQNTRKTVSYQYEILLINNLVLS